jgi:hypothetical protein
LYTYITQSTKSILSRINVLQSKVCYIQVKTIIGANIASKMLYGPKGELALK